MKYLILILVIFDILLIAAKLNLDKKTDYVPQPQNEIIRNYSPYPWPSIENIKETSDWKEYAVLGKEPKISENDQTEKFWSPDKKHYLLLIKPGGNLNGDHIALYESNGEFVFAFDPRRGDNIGFSGVAKRFHDYWLDNENLVFTWGDERYSGSVNTFKYNLVAKELSPVSEEYFDFDVKGGFLLVKPTSLARNTEIYYKKSDGSEIYLGSLEGYVNGLSKNGKYIVLLTRNELKEKPPTGEVYENFFHVIVAPVVVGGIKKGIEVGTVNSFVGGIETVVDMPFASWSEEDKRFKVNYHFIEAKEFQNPLAL